MEENESRETNEPIELGRRVFDLLPPPEVLARAPSRVKVTLVFSEDTLTWFKQQGERLNTPYQRMIRNLLDEYVRLMRAQEKEDGQGAS